MNSLVKILVVVGLLFGSFAFSFYLILEEAQKRTSDYYSIWESEISKQIALENSDLLLKKVNSQVTEMSAAIDVIDFVAVGDKAAKDIRSELVQQVPLSMNAILIGSLRIQYSVSKLIWTAVKSPVFLATIFLLLLTIGFLVFREQLNQLATERLRLEANHQKRIADLGRQVAHDIRAPLSAISALVAQMDGQKDSRARLLQQVSSRVEFIAEQLLRQTSNPEKLDRVANAEVEVPEIKGHSNSASGSESKSVLGIASPVIEEYRLRYPEIHWSVVGKDIQLQAMQETAQQVQRVLSNILQNAAESFAGEENINKSVLTKIQSIGDQIQIRITDTGKGISKDVLPLVFAKNFSKGKTNGNGLGLSAAREYLNRLGGDIELHSEPKRGTSCLLTIPQIISENRS